MFQVLRGAYMPLRALSTTEDQEAQELLHEIQQQPEVFVLSSPAVAITNVGTASEVLADGWSTESVSSVVRAAKTKQDDDFRDTVQGLDEGENRTKKTEPEDGQDDESEQSVSDSLQVRRQIARAHENMEHPSNRTLVRVLRLGGAKRRFVLAAAKNSIGVCVKHGNVQLAQS